MGEGPDDLRSRLAEGLNDFLDDLRRDGHGLGVGNYVDAQRLLLALDDDGLLAEGPGAFKVRLAPLVCKTPAQQDRFPDRFDAWARSLGPGRKPPPVALSATLDEVGREGRWFQGLAVTLFVAALVGGAGYGIADWMKAGEAVPQPSPGLDPSRAGPVPKSHPNLTVTTEPGLEDIPADAAPEPPSPSHEPPPAPAPIPEATPPPAGPDAQPKDSSRVPGLAWLALLGFLPVVWLLRKSWMDYRATLYLNQRQASGGAEVTRLPVGGRAPELFHGRRIEATAVRLRRRKRVGSGLINVPATVAATVKGGGLFTPVPGSRKVAPDYLVLVERSSYLDQQARLFDALADRLGACGVHLARYHFDRDPRDCLAGRGSVGLPELAMQHPDHRLVLLSNGSGLLDPVAGEPADWTGEFSSWPERVILTPEAPARWGHRERALERAGFVVLPATEEGLAALALHFEPGAGDVAPAFEPSPPYPPRLRRRPGRWLAPDEPEPVDVDGLLAELRRFLGPEGLSWLAACAVYPALEWDLTLYLGRILVAPPPSSGPLLDEGRLTALTGLPWFRHGSMPAWLRRRLISDLPPDREAEVRDALHALFVSSLGPDPEGFGLEVARERRPALRSMARRLFRLVRDRSPETDPSRDLVFADFMTGREPDSLAVALPRAVARALRPRRGIGPPPAEAGGLTPPRGAPPRADRPGTRVYLSVVDLELGSIRRRVGQVLRDYGCRPVNEGESPPDYRDAVERLRERIAPCGALIHIAGYCHGPEPKDAPPDAPRRSFAQLEYDIAIELGKPVYVFLTGNIFPTDPQKPEPLELRELQEAHRRRLTSNRRPFIRAGSVKGLERKIGRLPLRAGGLDGELEPLSSGDRLTRWAALVAVAAAIGGVAPLVAIGYYARQQRAEDQSYENQMKRLENERKAAEGAWLIDERNRQSKVIHEQLLKDQADRREAQRRKAFNSLDEVEKNGAFPDGKVDAAGGPRPPKASDSGIPPVDRKGEAPVADDPGKMIRPDEGAPDPHQSIPAPPPKTIRPEILESPVKGDENPRPSPAPDKSPADAFLGSYREEAKTSVEASLIRIGASSTGDLLDQLLAGETAEANDRKMRSKLDARSPRVVEERRVIRVVAFAHAVRKGASNDFHLVIGGLPAQGNPHYLFAVISGPPAPPNASTPLLMQVRDQFRRHFEGLGLFEEIFDTKKNSALYSIFDPPIPVIIEGSLFFNAEHRPGEAGPRSRRVETSWEIRPVTRIEFR